MDKEILYILSRENDGIKANINLIPEVSVEVLFSFAPTISFILNEESINLLKKEVGTLIKKVKEIKSIENGRKTNTKRKSTSK